MEYPSRKYPSRSLPWNISLVESSREYLSLHDIYNIILSHSITWDEPNMSPSVPRWNGSWHKGQVAQREKKGYLPSKLTLFLPHPGQPSPPSHSHSPKFSIPWKFSSPIPLSNSQSPSSSFFSSLSPPFSSLCTAQQPGERERAGRAGSALGGVGRHMASMRRWESYL